MKKIKKVLAMALLPALVLSIEPTVGSAAENVSIESPKTKENAVVSGSEEANEKLNNPLVKATVTTWDTVTFGNYWQEDTNQDGNVNEKDEKQPIQWRVLSVDGDEAYLLSEKILDMKSYNEKEPDITLGEKGEWTDCSLNRWLNNDFLSAAFTEEESGALNGTTEKVSLLSAEEIREKKYELLSNKACMTEGTSFVKQMAEYDEYASSWWTSSGETDRIKNAVNYGSVGSRLITDKLGVRPVIHLSLSSDTWNISEKVTIRKDFSSQWDCVWFGKYYQNNATVKQPIKWRVLSVNGDVALLIANRCLDYKAYNDGEESVTESTKWETSTLRNWMNNTFFNEAFTVEERLAIKEHTETKDKVSLMSLAERNEIAYGLCEKMGSARPTDYAVSRGAGTFMDMNAGFDSWMLRDKTYLEEGGTELAIACVSPFGSGGTCSGEAAIRPVIHISLSSNLWTSAGKISGLDDGSVEAYTPPAEDENKNTMPENTNNNAGGNKTETITANSKVTAPAKVILKSAKNKKGKTLAVKWKKIKSAEGYEMQYATNKKFKKKKSVQTKKTKYTLKKLKKKKTYYIRIRAYKLDGKKKVYGKWSVTKKVKIKK